MTGAAGAAGSLPDGYRLVSLADVASTNDEAKRWAAEGEPAGLVVTARAQTAGRGRHRRTWISPPGNLYLSILLRPTCPLARAAEAGFAAALALADTAADVLPPTAEVRCKWPNDVLVDGGKVAGILLETASEVDGRVAWLVIGIGVNVVAHPAAVPGAVAATSLAAAGAAADAATLRPRLLAHFDRWYRRWQADGFQPLRTAWRARGHRPGDPLTVRLADGAIAGHFADIDATGALVLDTAAGRRTITAGDCLPGAGAAVAAAAADG
jgi:BirA family biotin operon repressor/biotin-[acetyl-CoA-carboxylase] ligase